MSQNQSQPQALSQRQSQALSQSQSQSIRQEGSQKLTSSQYYQKNPSRRGWLFRLEREKGQHQEDEQGQGQKKEQEEKSAILSKQTTDKKPFQNLCRWVFFNSKEQEYRVGFIEQKSLQWMMKQPFLDKTSIKNTDDTFKRLDQIADAYSDYELLYPSASSINQSQQSKSEKSQQQTLKKHGKEDEHVNKKKSIPKKKKEFQEEEKENEKEEKEMEKEEDTDKNINQSQQPKSKKSQQKSLKKDDKEEKHVNKKKSVPKKKQEFEEEEENQEVRDYDKKDYDNHGDDDEDVHDEDDEDRDLDNDDKNDTGGPKRRQRQRQRQQQQLVKEANIDQEKDFDNNNLAMEIEENNVAVEFQDVAVQTEPEGKERAAAEAAAVAAIYEAKKEKQFAEKEQQLLEKEQQLLEKEKEIHLSLENAKQLLIQKSDKDKESEVLLHFFKYIADGNELHQLLENVIIARDKGDSYPSLVFVKYYDVLLQKHKSILGKRLNDSLRRSSYENLCKKRRGDNNIQETVSRQHSQYGVLEEESDDMQTSVDDEEGNGNWDQRHDAGKQPINKEYGNQKKNLRRSSSKNLCRKRRGKNNIQEIVSRQHSQFEVLEEESDDMQIYVDDE